VSQAPVWIAPLHYDEYSDLSPAALGIEESEEHAGAPNRVSGSSSTNTHTRRTHSCRGINCAPSALIINTQDPCPNLLFSICVTPYARALSHARSLS
jgi:hypothetical protein